MAEKTPPRRASATAATVGAGGNVAKAGGLSSYSSTVARDGQIPNLQPDAAQIIPFPNGAEPRSTVRLTREESERVVLGVLLGNRDGIRAARQIGLDWQHFQGGQGKHQDIAKTIYLLDAKGITFDVWIVGDELREAGRDDAALEAESLWSEAPSYLIEHLEHHATAMIRAQRSMALRNLAQQALKLADNGNADGAEELMRRRLAEIASIYAAVSGQQAKVWTLAELYATEFPPTFWAIPDLVSAGLNVLAGHPKIGKSFFALQCAHAAATGGKLFGVDVQRLRVLFIALEDNEGRLKERALAQKIPGNATLDIVFDWPLLHQGGSERIIAAIENGYDLVIVDTLGRMLGVQDRMDYGLMTSAVSPIQKATRQLNRAVMFLDHHGKLTTLASSGYASPVQDILGSTGLGGVVDTAIGLYTQRGKETKLLASAGRDTKGINLVIEFDPLTLAWQSLGDAKELAQSDLRNEIIDAIADLVDEETVPTAEEIAKRIGRKRPNIVTELQTMVTNGRVVKGAKIGKRQPYFIAGVPVPFYEKDETPEF